jgi:transposase
MYADMEQWTDIRHRVLACGVSKRAILKETGMHWKTLERVLSHSEPPGYQQRKQRSRPKIGAFEEWIAKVLADDKKAPRKQRHTAKRIFDRLKKETDFDGGYSCVKETVRRLRQNTHEVFVPLKHVPGEAQVDFGHALVRVDGILQKMPFFVMALPHSDAVFVAGFERECTETFWEGHVRAFEYFGGVPTRISYDNTAIAVSKILGGGQRKLTQGFLQLKSHYLFDNHFCRPARGNEKGVVEGLVKFTRSNFMVPVPQVSGLEELNASLKAHCLEDLNRRLRGKGQRKSDLLVEDRKAMGPLPPVPFEAARVETSDANSLSMVRFDRNDYSVPVCWAHHQIVIKGSCLEVILHAQGHEIARHSRIWDKEQVRFDPVHYLALLETKPGAFDYALPLDCWELPECFTVLRRRHEDRDAGQGTREYIRILRLLEKHSMPKLRVAIEKALEYRAISRDAIAQFLYSAEPSPNQTFNLEGHPHLKNICIQAPNLHVYAQLMGVLK